jgi:hypothetical protein
VNARIAIVGVVSLVSGCCGTCGMCSDSTPSTNVRTGGVRSEIDVLAGNGHTEVVTRLRVGGPLSNTFLDLAPGDRLEAYRGGRAVSLLPRRGMIEPPAFVGTFPGDSSGDAIEVRFARAGDTSAASRVVVPPALVVSAPAAGDRYGPSRSTVHVAWSPASSEPIEYSARGACIEPQSGLLSVDRGEVDMRLVPPAELDAGAPAACDVVVRLVREGVGTVDPAFGEGGHTRALQSAERVVRFVP